MAKRAGHPGDRRHHRVDRRADGGVVSKRHHPRPGPSQFERRRPPIPSPWGFAATAVTSLLIGSAIGTMGTVGVTLMGVGQALGVPAPLLAGALVSGAFFGDRTSLVSSIFQMLAQVQPLETRPAPIRPPQDRESRRHPLLDGLRRRRVVRRCPAYRAPGRLPAPEVTPWAWTPRPAQWPPEELPPRHPRALPYRWLDAASGDHGDRTGVAPRPDSPVPLCQHRRRLLGRPHQTGDGAGELLRAMAFGYPGVAGSPELAGLKGAASGPPARF